jgi:hypothetical protein
MTVMIPEAADAAASEGEVVEGEIVDDSNSPSVYREKRKSPPPVFAGNPSNPQRQSQSQSAGGPTITGPAKTYHRWVMAEFIGCIVLTGLTPLITQPKDAEGNDISGTDAMFGAEALIRLTALCVVFFILALLANHEKSGKFAAAFGGLILAGLLVNTDPTIWAKIGSLFKGNVGTGQQPTQPSSSSTSSGGLSGIKQDLSNLPSAIEKAAEQALKQIIPWG